VRPESGVGTDDPRRERGAGRADITAGLDILRAYDAPVDV
jgi:hypothetical protein